jgi:hypothetical protein
MRQALLFHGTILYRMPADCIARYLKHPGRQPEYRGERAHGAFLRTIPAPPEEIKLAIAAAWGVKSLLEAWPKNRMTESIQATLRRTQDEAVLDAQRWFRSAPFTYPPASDSGLPTQFPPRRFP